MAGMEEPTVGHQLVQDLQPLFDMACEEEEAIPGPRIAFNIGDDSFDEEEDDDMQDSGLVTPPPLSQESEAVLKAAIEAERRAGVEDPLQNPKQDPWHGKRAPFQSPPMPMRQKVGNVQSLGPMATAPSPSSSAAGSGGKGGRTSQVMPRTTIAKDRKALASPSTGGGRVGSQVRSPAVALAPACSVGQPVWPAPGGTKRTQADAAPWPSQANPNVSSASAGHASAGPSPASGGVESMPGSRAATAASLLLHPVALGASTDASQQSPSAAADFQRMFDAFQERTTAFVASSQADLQRNLQSEVHTLLGKFHDNVQNQFEMQNVQISELRNHIKAGKNDSKDIWSAIDRINSALALATDVKASAAVAAEENFDGPIDPARIRINCKELVDKSAIFEAVDGWLAEADLEDKYDILGPAEGLSKFWTVVVQGAEAVAKRRVSKALALLKNEAGIWRTMEALTPLGRMVDLFISGDKNKKQIETEKLSKRLFHLLKEAVGDSGGGSGMVAAVGGRGSGGAGGGSGGDPDGGGGGGDGGPKSEPKKKIPKLHFLKREGVVTCNWRPVAKVVPYPDRSYDVYWNQGQIEVLGINKEAILEALASTSGVAADGVEWSL